MKTIIPAILEKDFETVEKKLARIKDEVAWVQIDVIDGYFTDGRTFALELLTRNNELYDNLLYDIHLMVKEPITWINKAVFVNASRVIGQVEEMDNRELFVEMAKDKGLEVGLSFDIDTEIIDIPLETDVALLMGRKAGFGSLPMDKNIYKRIETLKKLQTDGDYHFKIAIDGGINDGNIGKLAEAGVEIFYCTSAVFDGNIENNLNNLKLNANSRRDK